MPNMLCRSSMPGMAGMAGIAGACGLEAVVRSSAAPRAPSAPPARGRRRTGRIVPALDGVVLQQHAELLPHQVRLAAEGAGVDLADRLAQRLVAGLRVVRLAGLDGPPDASSAAAVTGANCTLKASSASRWSADSSDGVQRLRLAALGRHHARLGLDLQRAVDLEVAARDDQVALLQAASAPGSSRRRAGRARSRGRRRSAPWRPAPRRRRPPACRSPAPPRRG